MTEFGFSGEDLINQGIRDFEYFDRLQKGLIQPHTVTGKRIIDPDTDHGKKIMEAFKKRPKKTFEQILENKLKARERARLYESGRVKSKREVKINARKFYASQLLSLNDCIWGSFKLSLDKKKAEKQIREAKKWVFETSDVLAFEKKHRKSLPSSASLDPDSYKEVAKQEISTADIQDKTIDQHDIPTIAFYKDGDDWKIGEKGKEKNFRHLRGFEHIAFLIRNKNYEYKPLEVEHFDNIPEDLKHLNEIYFQKIGDETELDNLIKHLEEQLSVEADHNKRDEKNRKLAKLKKIKNEGLNSFKQKANQCRINLYKNIKTAAQKIQKKLPALKKYFSCGNHKVIKTGTKFGYQQDQFGLSIDWILEKPS